ncbi:hypothetical protein H257_03791 [Aphanomyces astaci]|uniref:Uncharacterized protein n=1 Tax=Aphanomyces astaci TaxID=112090 RepID=W4H0G5_APHAT|nr:hypothetical protein H257_03791 [Aphanomyces astaci]ETV84648.1 hypothetical protein H257_03791 [Aphanomyces astaci]|eukprot:XP_009826340.1 hypothetical protein H257_03791 [Aphanomyces astaci]
MESSVRYGGDGWTSTTMMMTPVARSVAGEVLWAPMPGESWVRNGPGWLVLAAVVVTTLEGAKSSLTWPPLGRAGWRWWWSTQRTCRLVAAVSMPCPMECVDTTEERTDEHARMRVMLLPSLAVLQGLRPFLTIESRRQWRAWHRCCAGSGTRWMVAQQELEHANRWVVEWSMSKVFEVQDSGTVWLDSRPC